MAGAGDDRKLVPVRVLRRRSYDLLRLGEIAERVGCKEVLWGGGLEDVFFSLSFFSFSSPQMRLGRVHRGAIDVIYTAKL